MKKILSGLIGVFAIVGLVSASAYALFTAQATVSGLDLNTGTAGLEVSAPGFPQAPSINFGLEDTLVPGETNTIGFTLHNTSDDVDFNLTTKLTSAGGDWGDLNSLVNLTISYGGENVSGSLANWNAGEIPLPDGVDGPLESGETRTYEVTYGLDASATSVVAGKSLTNITFVFTGTQVEVVE